MRRFDQICDERALDRKRASRVNTVSTQRTANVTV
jgi:hypothetical protein